MKELFFWGSPSLVVRIVVLYRCDSSGELKENFLSIFLHSHMRTIYAREKVGQHTSIRHSVHHI